MKKFQIVLRQQELTPPEIDSGLVNFNGYLINPNTSLGTFDLVTKNDVRDYLENPQNNTVVTGFTKYLKDNTTDSQFKSIYYDDNRVSPLLNDYYRRRVRLDIDPRTRLIGQVLSGSSIVYYQDNNFDLETGHRLLTKEEKVIQTTEEPSYFVEFSIDLQSRQVTSGDFSKYVEDCVEDGVVLKNCFVNLNRQDDPFEYWNNERARFNIREAILGVGDLDVRLALGNLQIGSVININP